MSLPQFTKLLVWWSGSLQDCANCVLYSFLGGGGNFLVLEWIGRKQLLLHVWLRTEQGPQEETQVVGDERNRKHFGSHTRSTGSATYPSTPGRTLCHLTSRDNEMCRSLTDLFVTDGAESLQVVQGALPSSHEHWPDVVHLPEVPFPRASDHFIKLQQEHEISTF